MNEDFSNFHLSLVLQVFVYSMKWLNWHVPYKGITDFVVHSHLCLGFGTKCQLLRLKEKTPNFIKSIKSRRPLLYICTCPIGSMYGIFTYIVPSILAQCRYTFPVSSWSFPGLPPGKISDLIACRKFFEFLGQKNKKSARENGGTRPLGWGPLDRKKTPQIKHLK